MPYPSQRLFNRIVNISIDWSIVPLMHPVLARTLLPIAEEISAASLSETQILPLAQRHQWCGQQVVEHLILMFRNAQEDLNGHLKKHRPAANTRTTLQ